MGTINRSCAKSDLQHTHTHRLGGRAVNIYFVDHAEVIRCEHKMVYYFHVRRIQNLLQMIMAQGFPAWVEEGMFSRAAAETTANFKSTSSEQVTIDVRM